MHPAVDLAPRARPRTWLLAGAAAAGTAYLRLVDPTRSGGASLPCPFRAATGLDCPFCGSTRAAWALVHGDPVRAFGYNALLVAILPLALWAWGLDVRGRFGTSRHPFRRPTFWMAAGALAVAFSIARNLPWDPWRALAS